MKAILADDELTLLEHLKQALTELWPELEIVGTASNGKSAVELIMQHKPDIAFLDIRMPSLTGLEVATQVADRCSLIFVTAYDNYAIEAFEANAVDYLLKPFSRERLQKTVDRLQQKQLPGAQPFTSPKEIIDLLTNLQHNKRNDSQTMHWFRSSLGDDTFLIHVNDVLYLESDTKYTNVVSKEGSFPIRMSLTELEEKLDKEKFQRIHRNAIVNLHAIDRVKRLIDGRYTVHIKDHDKELTVSRSYAANFKQM